MCVAAVAWQAHPRWRLVAIGNRDEYHDRPSAALGHWDNGVIAGRDLRSGGAWIGVTESRFALVTNLRGYGERSPDKASRGTLVTDMLTRSGRYADPQTARLADFNPFNLILADGEQARFLSNRPDEIRAALAHGVYGLSNGALDEPWPKTLQLKGALTDWLAHETEDLEPLFAALANDELPDLGVPPREPSDVAREAPQTPVFILDPIYGTRCGTVLAIDHAGMGTIAERRFSPQGDITGSTLIKFRWPG
jgi:uncharacterized protein with NRDE domain